METLKVKSGKAHNIIPDIKFEEEFNEIALGSKADEILGLYENSEQSIEVVADVLKWAAETIGKKNLLDYLTTPPCSRLELIDYLKSAESPQDYDLWSNYYDLPALSSRFEQLAILKSKQSKVLEIIDDDVKFYPIRVGYKDIFTKHMPSFQYNDALTERITHPDNSIARLNNGLTVVDSNLLDAIRGKYKATPPGISYKNTHYGELHQKSNILGNYGIMLIAENLQSRQELREISRASGVDCLSAGLAEGIAIANTGLLRIGDVIGLPKYIPNTKGDYYCGINVLRQYANNQYEKSPKIYFGLWMQEGSQNCILAITS